MRRELQRYRTEWRNRPKKEKCRGPWFENLVASHRDARKSTLIDAVAAAAAISPAAILSPGPHGLDAERLEQAIQLQFPGLTIDQLASYSTEQMAGIISGVKGKYFELEVVDALNSGDAVGDIQLEPGQIAKLAESATQTGWDVQILNDSGLVDSAIQVKATDSLGYVREALADSPGIEFVTTSEISQALPGLVESGGLTNEDLTTDVTAALLGDAGGALDAVFPALPFVVIGAHEGAKVLMGSDEAIEAVFARVGRRAGKSAAAMTAGGAVVFLDGGVLSIPVAFGVRSLLDAKETWGYAEQTVVARYRIVRSSGAPYRGLLPRGAP